MSAKRGPRKKKSRSHARRVDQSRKTGAKPANEKTGDSSISGDKENRVKKKRVPPQLVTGRRLWLFRILAATVIPALLLLLVELSLRVAGYGFNANAIVKCKLDGQDAYCDNLKFGWRFFPKEIARQFEPFVFPAAKLAGAYRIFVLGASAARGEPDPSFCFSRILRLMLQDQYPQVKFEVINTAVVAINSHVVLEIAKDCARCDADLFIVYLGNNEVTGPYGAGTVYTPPSGNLPIIRTAVALKATRLGQLVAAAVKSISAGRSTPRIWRGLEMFLDSQVRADAPDLEAVYLNYEKNLQDINRVVRKSGAKILLSTVGSNLKDCPPFASLHRSDLTDEQLKEWSGIYDQGAEHESAGDHAGAVESYLAAARIDDHYADLQFRLGRCYWALGQYDQARDRYIQARKLDTLRFRADARINSIIRDVAGNETDKGVYLADAARAFEENSDHETPGEELFYEHVHLNFEGTYLLAKTIFEQVQKMVPQDWTRRKDAGERSVPTRDECAARLAYTDWDKHAAADRILDGFIKKPPFTNQLYQRQRVERMEQDIEGLKSNLTAEVLARSAAEYRWAIDKSPGDWRLHWKYGKVLTEGLKDYRAAAEQYRLVQELVPHSHLGHTAMGAVSRGLGDLDKVIAEYLEAIRIKPTSIDAHYYVAWAYYKQGKIDLAKEYYAKTRQLHPAYVPAYNDVVEILYKQGKVGEAVGLCREGLGYSPKSSILRGNLGMLLNMQGHRDEAVKELRIALELDPNSGKIRKMLDTVLRAPK